MVHHMQHTAGAREEGCVAWWALLTSLHLKTSPFDTLKILLAAAGVVDTNSIACSTAAYKHIGSSPPGVDKVGTHVPLHTAT